jgi:hypothetical protein
MAPIAATRYTSRPCGTDARRQLVIGECGELAGATDFAAMHEQIPHSLAGFQPTGEHSPISAVRFPSETAIDSACIVELAERVHRAPADTSDTGRPSGCCFR